MLTAQASTGGGSVVTAIFSVSDCPSPAWSLSLEQQLIVEIVVPIVALLIIAVIVVFAVPTLRKKVMPYHDRSRHEFVRSTTMPASTQSQSV